jgi:hypothetical protein
MNDSGDEIRRLKAIAFELGFLYEGHPAGVFLGPERPSVSGRFRYDAYRGDGHFQVGRALQAGVRPRCTFSARPDVSFTVQSCPEPGVIELSDFVGGGGEQASVSLE